MASNKEITKAKWRVLNSFLTQNRRDWVVKNYQDNSWHHIVGRANLIKQDIEKQLEKLETWDEQDRQLMCLTHISICVTQRQWKPMYVCLMFIVMDQPYSNIYYNFLTQVLTNQTSDWDQLFVSIKDIDYIND